MRTLIEYCHPARSSRAINFLFQKLLSARSSLAPVASACVTRAISSSAKRSTPRGLPADPLRNRMYSTSPMSARVASSG